MSTYTAYASPSPGAPLAPQLRKLRELSADEVDLEVLACGICHSDLSMLDNAWGRSEYPFVGGHEVVGRVKRKGANVQHLEIGDRVGLGWKSRSCLVCRSCLSGDQHLCQTESTIVGRDGGFAERVICQSTWAIPLPAALGTLKAGPLFCGGLTVFAGLIESGLLPTHRVGVIGIGGLGHLALQFCNKWGCEVTAFTSSENKAEEARGFGAHRVVNSRDEEALRKEAGRFDLILSTVSVHLPWQRYLAALGPRGKLHVVGAALKPMDIPAFALIGGQKKRLGQPRG